MSKDVQHEKDAYANHVKYSENLIADQRKCVQSAHHELVNWFQGDPPVTSGPPAPAVLLLPESSVAPSVAVIASTSAAMQPAGQYGQFY